MTDTWDVIVVGGGPAGSTAANLFAAHGRRVLLLDAARFPRSKPCAEYISPGGVAILERLGALERLHTGRWLRGMQVQAPGGACQLVEYRPDDEHSPRFGLSVSRSVLDATLLELARERGVEVREQSRVQGVWSKDGRVRGVVVGSSKGERLAADELVVGADGLHSKIASSVGARKSAYWPRRLGLVAHFEGVAWPQDYGRMLVGSRSYVGIAPLDESGLVTVGLVRSMPKGRLGSPAAAFEAALADYPDVTSRLGRGHLASAVTGVGPLASRVHNVAGPGYALIGDAAGFFDPFTGEGIFRALRSAELLAALPSGYARARRTQFAAKERLVALIQLFVQTPRLMDFVVQRLQCRADVARELGCVLGDLQPARPRLVWRLLGP
jgi:flavin-dependent dehydrogenase